MPILENEEGAKPIWAERTNQWTKEGHQGYKWEKKKKGLKESQIRQTKTSKVNVI